MRFLVALGMTDMLGAEELWQLRLPLFLTWNSALALPVKRCAGRIRSDRCLSVASFGRFPSGASIEREPEGQRLRGRLSLLTFFGEAKKVSSCRATPGKSLRRKTKLIEGRKNNPSNEGRHRNHLLNPLNPAPTPIDLHPRPGAPCPAAPILSLFHY